MADEGQNYADSGAHVAGDGQDSASSKAHVAGVEENSADTKGHMAGAHNGYVTPDLPSDKEYHTMLSYHHEDRAWVITLLDTMEAQPYNLKCCFHERDFLPGKETITNIETSIEQSLSVILIITPDHLSSSYCDLETKMALQMKHEGTVKLIPVLRRGDEIPQFLRFITYIDAREDDDTSTIVQKLATAVMEGLPETTNTYNINQDDQSSNRHCKSGDEFAISAEYRTFKSSILKAYSFPPLSPQGIIYCADLGFKMSVSSLNSLCELISRHSYNYNVWWYHTKPGVASLTVWLMMFSAAAVFISTVLVVMSVSVEWLWTTFIGLAIVGGISAPIIWIVKRRKYIIKERDRFSYRITVRTIARDLMVILDSKNNKPCLRFIYYDLTPCKKYIKETLEYDSPVLLGISSSVEHVQTDDIVRCALATYIPYMLTEHGLATRSRHFVQRNMQCLCQFIDSNDIYSKCFKHKLEIRHTTANKCLKFFNCIRGIRGEPTTQPTPNDDEMLVP